jgi:hypothetical protein
MPSYDLFVDHVSRADIEAKARAWREHFGLRDTWMLDLPRILEIALPSVLPQFALRVLPNDAMPDAEARTWHAVPAIDMREDIYDRLCAGDGRARFTASHELGHLFLHSGEARPRAVAAIRPTTIPRSRSSEMQANDFAASFLMPEHIVSQFANLTPADLSEACGVTQSAAEYRMRELRYWPRGRPPIPEVEDFLRKMKRDGNPR